MYSERAQDHYRFPRNLGRLAAPDGVGEVAVREPTDNWLQFQLAVQGEMVEQARFRAIGCAATIAAGSVLTEWVQGQHVAGAGAQLSPSLVLNLLDGLPEEKLFCAELAVAALRAALADVGRGGANAPH
jgi:NifU-like protein involved in Fe-S cluster formation